MAEWPFDSCGAGTRFTVQSLPHGVQLQHWRGWVFIRPMAHGSARMAAFRLRALVAFPVALPTERPVKTAHCIKHRRFPTQVLVQAARNSKCVLLRRWRRSDPVHG